MIDIGLPEILVIAVVTLLVVGPKDLPNAIRGMARAFRQLQGFVGEFKSGVNEFLRETELEEFRDRVNKTKAAMTAPGQLDEFLDPDGSLRRDLYGDVEPKKETGDSDPPKQEEPENPADPATDTSRKDS